MFDLTALQPFIAGFFVLAAVATGLAVATLVSLAQERRSSTGAVVAFAATHPGAATVTRRAA